MYSFILITELINFYIIPINRHHEVLVKQECWPNIAGESTQLSCASLNKSAGRTSPGNRPSCPVLCSNLSKGLKSIFLRRSSPRSRSLHMYHLRCVIVYRIFKSKEIKKLSARLLTVARCVK